MSAFVESLKRLYSNGRLADGKLDELRAAGKIKETEYQYIMNKNTENREEKAE